MCGQITALLSYSLLVVHTLCEIYKIRLEMKQFNFYLFLYPLIHHGRSRVLVPAHARDRYCHLAHTRWCPDAYYHLVRAGLFHVHVHFQFRVHGRSPILPPY